MRFSRWLRRGLLLYGMVAPICGASVLECSEAALRAAVSSGGIVSFQCEGTITLTEPLIVQGNVTLDAAGRQITIDGGSKVRLFTVVPSAALTLKSLTLANGADLGKSGADAAPLPTDGEPGRGGIIAATNAVIKIESCLVTNGLARGGDSYVWNSIGEQQSTSPGDAMGGAVYLDGGELSIQRSEFSGNRALPGTGYEPANYVWKGASAEGGSIWARSAQIALSDSRFLDSVATSIGGGALLINDSQLNVASCVFSNNIVRGVRPSGSVRSYPAPDNQGGALRLLSTPAYITNSLFISNSVSSTGGRTFAGVAEGGALRTDAMLSVVQSSFLGNSVLAEAGVTVARHSAGGAISSVAPLQISSSRFYGNSCASGSSSELLFGSTSDSLGGAIYNESSIVLFDSSFVANSVIGGINLGRPTSGAARGGAIFASDSLYATNITCASNNVSRTLISPPSPPSSQSSTAQGGAIYVSAPSAHVISYSTFVGNFLTEGSAVEPPTPITARTIFPLFSPGIVLATGTNANLSLHASILAGGSSNLASGDILDLGYNLSTDSSLTNSSSRNYIDPGLTPLTFLNGLDLFLLQPTSPAKDAADPLAFPPFDARGLARPFGFAPDVGAVESELTQASVSIKVESVAGKLEISATSPLQGPVVLLKTTDFRDWLAVQTNNVASVPFSVAISPNQFAFFKLIALP